MSSKPDSSERRAESNVGDTTYNGTERAAAAASTATNVTVCDDDADLHLFLRAGREHRLQSVHAEGRGIDVSNYKNNSIFTPPPPRLAPPAADLPQKRYHIPFNPCLPMSATSAGGGGMLEQPPIFAGGGGSSGDCVPMIGTRGHDIMPTQQTSPLGTANGLFNISVASISALHDQNTNRTNQNQHHTSSTEHTHGHGGHHGHSHGGDGGDHQRERNEPFVIGCCPMIAVPTTSSSSNGAGRGGGGRHTAQRGRGRHHHYQHTPPPHHHHHHHHEHNRHPNPNRHQHNDSNFSRGNNYGPSPSFSSSVDYRLSHAMHPSSPFFSQPNQVLRAPHQQTPHEREQESTTVHNRDDDDDEGKGPSYYYRGRGEGRHTTTRTRGGGGSHYLGGGAFAPTCPSFGYDFPPTTPYSQYRGGGTSASSASASGHHGGKGKGGGEEDGLLVVKTASLPLPPPPPPTEVPPPQHATRDSGSPQSISSNVRGRPPPPPPSHCCNTQYKRAKEAASVSQNTIIAPPPSYTSIETQNATAQSVPTQNRAAQAGGPPEHDAAPTLQTEESPSNTLLLLRAEEPQFTERATVREEVDHGHSGHSEEQRRYSALTPGCCPIIGGGGGSGSGTRGSRGRGGGSRRPDHTNNSSAATAIGGRARGAAETIGANTSSSNSGAFSAPPAPPAAALPQKRYHIPFNPCLPMSATSAGGGGMLERPPTAIENAGSNTNNNNNCDGRATTHQPPPARNEVHVPSTSHHLPRRGVAAHRGTRTHAAAAAAASQVTESHNTPSTRVENLEVDATAGSSAEALLVHHQPIGIGSAPLLLPRVSSSSSSDATATTSSASSQNVSEVTSGGVAPPGGVPTDGWGGTLLQSVRGDGVVHGDGGGYYGYRGAAEGSSSSETVVNGLREFEQWEWEWRMSKGSRGRGGCWCPHYRKEGGGGIMLGEVLSSNAIPLSFSTSAFVSSSYPPATAAAATEPRSLGVESAFSFMENKKSFGSNSRPIADAELMSSTADSLLSPLAAASTSATVRTSTTATISNHGTVLNEVSNNREAEGSEEVSIRWFEHRQGLGRSRHRQPSSLSLRSHSSRAPLPLFAERQRRKGDTEAYPDEEDVVGAEDAECSTVAGLSSLAHLTQANSLFHYGGGGGGGSDVHLRGGLTSCVNTNNKEEEEGGAFVSLQLWRSQEEGRRGFSGNTNNDDGQCHSAYRRGLGEAFCDNTAHRGWYAAVDEDDEGEEASSYHTMLHGDRCRESDTIVFNIEDQEDTFFTDPLLHSDAYSAALERYQRELEQKEICGRKIAPYRRPKVRDSNSSKGGSDSETITATAASAVNYGFPSSLLIGPPGDRKMGIEWEIVETRMAKGDEDVQPQQSNTISSPTFSTTPLPPRRVCPCPRFGHTAVVVGDFSGSSATAKEMLARRGIFSPFTVPSLFSSNQNEGSYCGNNNTCSTVTSSSGGSSLVYQGPSRFYPSKEQRKQLGVMPPRYMPARSTSCAPHTSPPQSPPPTSANFFTLPVPLPPNLPPMMLLFGGRSDTTRQGDVWAFTIEDNSNANKNNTGNDIVNAEEADAVVELKTNDEREEEEAKAVRRSRLGHHSANEQRGRGAAVTVTVAGGNSEVDSVRVASVSAAVVPRAYPLLTCDEDDLNFRAPPPHLIRSYVYSEDGRLRQQQEQQIRRQEEDEGSERRTTRTAVANAPHSSAASSVNSVRLSGNVERKEGSKSEGTKGTWRLLKRGLPFSLPPLVPTTELPSPPPRCGHAAIASSKGTMLIFGGSIADDLCTNDCWEYSLTGFYGVGQGGVGDGSRPYSSNLLNTFSDDGDSTIRTTPTPTANSGGPSVDGSAHFSVGYWRLRTSQGMYEDDLARQKKQIVDQYHALLEAYQQHVSAAMQQQQHHQQLQQQQSLPKASHSSGPPPPPMQHARAQRPPPPPRGHQSSQAPPPPPAASSLPPPPAPPSSTPLVPATAPIALQQFVLRHQNTTIGNGYPLARKGHTFTAVGQCHAVLIGGCNPCLRVGSPIPIFSLNPLAPAPNPWPTYTIASIAAANEDLTRTVWTLNFGTNKWRSYVPVGVGPRGRTYHVAAASCARKSVFVFGGVSVTDAAGTRFDNSTFFNDLFELVFRCEGDEKDRGPPLWRKIETIGGPLPSPRMCSSIILKGHKLVMFMGGARELARDSDAYYELDTQTFKWRRIRFLAGHPPCSRPTTVLLENRIVSFGGALDCHGGFSNTTYALTLQAPTLKALCREWLRHKTSQVDLGEGAVPNHIDQYLSQNGGDFGALEGEDEGTDLEEGDAEELEEGLEESASSGGRTAAMSDADEEEDDDEENNAWRGGEEGEENEDDAEEEHDDEENEATILLPYLAQDATERPRDVPERQ